ncbi:Piso0_002336 [Millerozyma farinosa CBS 7064]|uniref:Piso0_002336 protein n=1 Tax=Pichia sorbitophila (strain ATCC MYA-4447 / BCRC 22081 / CBS 7064 / NBRC 10061 / NRRL Y-12695) TaxID=559304 RepID=G8YES4_PICSO|nr:Piso0_002336 [Millerozyma farinosa CBS 7064]
MPPKSSKVVKNSDLVAIKFKRNKVTFVVLLDLVSKSSKSINKIKETLCDVISASGGLNLKEVETDGLKEDDIVVPKSEYLTESNDEDEKEDNTDIVKNISPNDIRLAIPKDKTSPYDNEWIEITNDSIFDELTFNDYDIIAFAYKTDDGFYVEEATYNE